MKTISTEIEIVKALYMYFQEKNCKNNSAGFVWPNLCTNITSRLTMHNVFYVCVLLKSPWLSVGDIFKEGNTFNRQQHIIVCVCLLKLFLKVLITRFIEKSSSKCSVSGDNYIINFSSSGSESAILFGWQLDIFLFWCVILENCDSL